MDTDKTGQVTFDEELQPGYFVQISSDFLQSEEYSLEAKGLYALLLTYAGKGLVAWPGQETLARKLSISQKSVRNGLRELHSQHLITIKRRGQGKVNNYHVHKFILRTVKTTVQEESKMPFKNGKNDTSRTVKTTGELIFIEEDSINIDHDAVRVATVPTDKTIKQSEALPLNSTKPSSRPITPAPKPEPKAETKRPAKEPDPAEVSDEAREAYEHARAKFGGRVPKGMKLAWLDNRVKQFGRKCVLASITRGEERSVETAVQIGAIMERMTPAELKQFDDKGNRAGRAPVPISTNQRYQSPQSKPGVSALDYMNVDLYGVGS